MKICFKPIGSAKNKYREKYSNWSETHTKITIKKEFANALEGLDKFSHVQVIFWLHKVTDYDLQIVPQGKLGKVPKVGIFACRTQYRINPIGVTIAKIIKIQKNTIKVKGLDVLNNTPIIDLKPYIPHRVKNVKYPNWVKELKKNG